MFNPDDWSWHERARCAKACEVDQATFTTQAPTKEEARDIARRYCDDCPVKNQCFNWAKREPLFSGVAGGCVFAEQKSMQADRHVRRIITKPKESPSA